MRTPVLIVSLLQTTKQPTSPVGQWECQELMLTVLYRHGVGSHGRCAEGGWIGAMLATEYISIDDDDLRTPYTQSCHSCLAYWT